MSQQALQGASPNRPSDHGRYSLRPTDASLALRLIGKALAAGHDLDETLKIVVDLAAEITDAVFTRVLLLEDDGWLVCHTGQGCGDLFLGDRIPRDSGLAGVAMTTRSIVQSPDVRSDKRSTNRDAAVRYGIRAYLAIPLLLHTEALGVLTVGTTRAPDFSSDDIALLSAFADQSAAAVERARLRKAEQEQLTIITELLAAANSIGAAVDLPSVLARLSETSIQVIGCQGCVVWLVDQATGRLVPAYPPGVADRLAKVQAKAPSGGEGMASIGEMVIEGKSPVLIEDTRASTLAPAELIQALGATAMMDVPIMIGDRVLGAIGINCNRGPHRFTRREQAIAQGLANLAGIAIEHARTVTRWEEAMLADERGRLAREVHDTVAQELVALATRVDLCQELVQAGELVKCSEELEAIRETLTSGIQEVRRTIAGLRPLELERFGFVGAMGRFLDAFSARTGIRSELTIRGEFVAMPGEPELVLYRVAQEALSNVHNHAQATSVRLELDTLLPERVCMSIQDNGNGQAPGREPRLDGRYGVGLALMRERVERAAGTLQVSFVPNSGTTVSVFLPRSPK